MSRPTTAVARLSAPEELAAAVPHLCGYQPDESLVVLALHGARSRLGLTQAAPLPPPAATPSAADHLLRNVHASGARQAVVLLYTARAPATDVVDVRPDVLDAVLDASERRRVSLAEVLLVHDGRCWSLLCAEPACCPPEGRLVASDSSGLTLLQAQSAAQGRAVLVSRAELVDSLAPPTGPQAAEAARALARVERRLVDEVGSAGLVAVRARLLAAWRAALQQSASPPLVLEPDDAALLALALHDLLLRDQVLTWALSSEEALLTLLLELARQVPSPGDAPLCAVLAGLAYSRGDGALANVALDRALASDPEHTLALLLRRLLDGLVPPGEVRQMLRETKRALRPTSRSTARRRRASR